MDLQSARGAESQRMKIYANTEKLHRMFRTAA